MTSRHVTVERGTDGGAVVIKRAQDEGGAAALAGEAWILASLDHAGVVHLLEYRPGPPAELVTRYAGDRTLAHAAVRSVDRVIALATALSETIADLHGLGLVHGKVTSEHVLIGAEGRPVLCGFGASGPETGSRRKADDVFSIGVLLRLLLDDDTDVEPIPDRRPAPWRQIRWSGYLRRALLTLADQATADEPSRRPSARQLAGALRATRPEPHSGPPRARRLGRPVLAAAGLLSVVLLAVVVLGAPGEGEHSTTRPPEPPPESTTGPGSTVPPATATSRAPSVCPGGEGCSEPISLGPGRVQVGSTTFRVGRPEDRLALGDWDCDGIATPALLRTDTGEVFTFPAWDPTGSGTRGELVARRPGASDLVVLDEGGCSALSVRLEDGSVEPLLDPRTGR